MQVTVVTSKDGVVLTEEVIEVKLNASEKEQKSESVSEYSKVSKQSAKKETRGRSF